jgi:hypothetical protein
MSLVKFTSQHHTYTSIDNDDDVWMSVSKVISSFKNPFDEKSSAEKSSVKKNSKWYGISSEEIKDIWKKENERSVKLGKQYHSIREKEKCDENFYLYNGKKLHIFKPIENEDFKYSPPQKLNEGVYPEHLIYLKSAKICGQSDEVLVYNNIIDVNDFKTNKEIKTKGYVNWEGIEQKMLYPLQNLPDCNYTHYSLQLSLYMYMMLKHNPQKKCGRMTIEHIIFEEERKDKYQYPIIRYENGLPIVKDIIKYDVPYLKSEVILMMQHLENIKMNDLNT